VGKVSPLNGEVQIGKTAMRTHPLLVATALIVLHGTLPADDWPQWRGPERDGVWRESGIIDKFDGPTAERRWTADLCGGYSGPTVARGRVYVTDRLTEPDEIERVLCFDCRDGRKLWSCAYPCKYTISYRDGPRASVTVDDGRAYALGAMGHLHCLEAASGKVIWKKVPGRDYRIRMPIWGIAAAPLVENDLVIVQIGIASGGCVAAFDKRTGRLRWKALDDPASYSAPIAIDQAGRRVIVCWTGARLTGLDAQTGKLLWQHPFKHRRWIDMVATPVQADDRILVASFDEGALMIKLHHDQPAAERFWLRLGRSEFDTKAIQPMISTPLIIDGYIYGFDSYGQFRCLSAETGQRIWEDRTATSQTRWGTAHLVRNGDNVWLFNDRGELIISRLSPQGYREISRAKLIDPTRGQLNKRNGVTWSHPAFAYKHVFARNDEELVCAPLAAEQR